MTKKQLQLTADNVQNKLWAWYNEPINIGNYRVHRDRGIALLAQSFLLSEMGATFTEVEIYIQQIFGIKDCEEKVREVIR